MALAAVLHRFWRHRHPLIAALALLGIGAHLLLRFGLGLPPEAQRWPLLIVLLGVVVGTLVIIIYLPIFYLGAAMKQGLG